MKKFNIYNEKFIVRKTYSIKLPKNIIILTDNNYYYIKNGLNKIAFLKVKNILLVKENNKIFLTVKSFKNPWDKSNELNKLKFIFKLFSNVIIGLSIGFFSQLECKGLGFKAKVKQKFLILNLGFSHKLKFEIPKDIIVFCSKTNIIVFFGTNKQKLFEFMNKIRSYKKPDKYKGKGLKFKSEILKLKEGKNL